MEGKIDQYGVLWIERAGKMKEQMCPFDSPPDANRTPWSCGDVCPLFGEPWPSNKSKTKWLSLCHTEIKFDSFTDERGV